jgi:hypothetical protein
VTWGGGAKPRRTDNITIGIFVIFNDIYATFASPFDATYF